MASLPAQLPRQCIVALLIVLQVWVSGLRLPGVCVASPATAEAPTACERGEAAAHDHGCLPQPATHDEGPCCSHRPLDDATRPSGSTPLPPPPVAIEVMLPGTTPVEPVQVRSDTASARIVRPPPDLPAIRIIQLQV